MNPVLTLTDDGSHTLYLDSLDEHYHSRFGAMTESKHVFINAGLASIRKKDLSVLEVGFGTGLNALLTAIYADEKGISVRYVTLENNPPARSLIAQLNYGELTGKSDLFSAIHDAQWNKAIQVTEHFVIEKKLCDFTETTVRGTFDLVYFDAFSPDRQPEMWRTEQLKKITDVVRTGSVFVTYSAKGDLKRRLRDLGFEVSHLPGPPGKRVFTRAVKL